MPENSGTGLATIPQHQPAGLTVYDRVDPMEFINQMGKVFALSGAAGCENESQGKLMALAVLCKRQDVFEISRRYHLMGGKLVLKAEIMLGDFRRVGGKHRWLKDGSDGQEASLELIDKDGNKIVSSFSIEKARLAGYIKPKSQWEKRPDQMLRARCITDGIRMICPEISAGEVAEEEMEDVLASAKPGPATAAAKPTAGRTAAEIKQRQQELQATATSPVATATTPDGTAAAQDTAIDPVIDVQMEPATTAAATTVETTAPTPSAPTEAPPFDAQAESIPGPLPGEPGHDAHTQVLMEIELTISKAGLTIATVIDALNKKGGTAYKSLDDLSEDNALTLLENLRAIIARQLQQAG